MSLVPGLSTTSIWPSGKGLWHSGKELVAPYLDLALAVKLAVGALIGLIAGPGLLGYVSEYATYWFAFHEGIRPPLEGIPYLRTAVTTSSFALALLSALAFIVALLAASLVVWLLHCILGYSITIAVRTLFRDRYKNMRRNRVFGTLLYYPEILPALSLFRVLKVCVVIGTFIIYFVVIFSLIYVLRVEHRKAGTRKFYDWHCNCFAIHRYSAYFAALA